MKRILLLLLTIFLSSSSYSQKEGNIWYFGNYSGLDFNVNPPVSIPGSILANEGCSCISDPVTGQFLFGTNGVKVWDRNGNLMPGILTTPLNGHTSSTQAIIVPWPGSATKYYIITTPAQAGYYGNSAMCYSVVDLSLNGGDGDVTSINTTMMDTSTEKVTVVGNCDRSAYWIIGHRWNCDSFYAFRLTASGFDAPVKSKVGTMHQGNSINHIESIGYMKCSPDGRKLGLVITYLDIVELFDFDFNTGIISNPITDTLPYQEYNPYGCSFSPDNSKFYVGGEGFPMRVFQYDMNAGSAAAILASKTMVATVDSGFILGALQNGPDGRMYVAGGKPGVIDVILNPNEAGLGCNYIPFGQDIGGPLRNSGYGLPAIVESFYFYNNKKFQIPQNNKLCKGDTLVAPQRKNSFFVIAPNAGVEVNEHTSAIAFSPDTTTTYVITNTNDCGPDDTTYFTVYVSNPAADFEFNPADPSPADIQIVFNNQSKNAHLYSWYDADRHLLSTTKEYLMPHPGLGNFCYTLIAQDTLGCADSVRKCIDIRNGGTLFIPNTFSPNGDGLNDVFRIYGLYKQLDEFSIYNRYGERVFHTKSTSAGWDGLYKARRCDVGTYYYIIKLVNNNGEQESRKGQVTLVN